jgi:putative phosphoesterase
MILHAGDIGGEHVLDELRKVAPVMAVRGNNDHEDWAGALPETLEVTVEGVRIHVLHDVKRLALDPARAGVKVVVAGHSHRPRREMRAGVLYFNPGSAGPRRFSLPIAVGRLVIRKGVVRASLMRLDGRDVRAPTEEKA